MYQLMPLCTSQVMAAAQPQRNSLSRPARTLRLTPHAGYSQRSIGVCVARSRRDTVRR